MFPNESEGILFVVGCNVSEIIHLANVLTKGNLLIDFLSRYIAVTSRIRSAAVDEI